MKILIIGFGSIGQAILHPLIKDLGIEPKKISIISKAGAEEVAQFFGCKLEFIEITENNFESVLKDRLESGDWLLNLSVNVSSFDLIKWCQKNDIFYLDTCIEPWEGGYKTSCLDIEKTTNYALRHQVRELRVPGTRTAVIAHGANPGLVSHLTKELIDILIPGKSSFAERAHEIKLKSIHISERDTQVCNQDFPEDVFVNTWSPDGFISELGQMAEIGLGLGIGLKESFSVYNEFSFGDKSSVWLNSQGRHTRVKTWVPSSGEIFSYLVTHHESISIASLLTLRDSKGEVIYRPSVQYSYVPSSHARRSIDSWNKKGDGWDGSVRVIKDEIVSGSDELGVLFVFDDRLTWYGSILDIEEARSISPFNNATSLQVVGGIIGAMKWAMENPYSGIVEAEDMDHKKILYSARPYLGSIMMYNERVVI